MSLDRPLTTQEAFDTVVCHLHSMKFRSREGGVCVYHSPQEDGTVLKCAIGCLIPDKEYSSDIEGMDFFQLMTSDGIHPSIREAIRPLNVRDEKYGILLGSELQSLHDEDYNWDDGLGLDRGAITELSQIALKYNLNPSVIKELKWSKGYEI